MYRQAVSSLVTHRVPCNQAMVESPGIVCSDEDHPGTTTVSIIGLLQDVARLEGDKFRIAIYEENGTVIGFGLVERGQFQ